MLEYVKSLKPINKIHFLFCFFILKFTCETYSYNQLLNFITQSCSELTDRIKENDTMNDEQFHNDLKTISKILEIILKKYTPKVKQRNPECMKKSNMFEQETLLTDRNHSLDNKLHKMKLNNKDEIKTTAELDQIKGRKTSLSPSKMVSVKKHFENYDQMQSGIGCKEEINASDGKNSKKRKTDEEIKIPHNQNISTNQFNIGKKPLKTNGDSCIVRSMHYPKKSFPERKKGVEDEKTSRFLECEEQSVNAENISDSIVENKHIDSSRPDIVYNALEELSCNLIPIQIYLASSNDSFSDEVEEIDTLLDVTHLRLASSEDSNLDEIEERNIDSNVIEVGLASSEEANSDEAKEKDIDSNAIRTRLATLKDTFKMKFEEKTKCNNIVPIIMPRSDLKKSKKFAEKEQSLVAASQVIPPQSGDNTIKNENSMKRLHDKINKNEDVGKINKNIQSMNMNLKMSEIHNMLRKDLYIGNEKERLQRILNVKQFYFSLHRDFGKTIQKFQTSFILTVEGQISFEKHKILLYILNQIKRYLTVDLLYINFNSEWASKGALCDSKNSHLLPNTGSKTTECATQYENKDGNDNYKTIRDILKNEIKAFFDKKSHLMLSYACLLQFKKILQFSLTKIDMQLIKDFSELVIEIELINKAFIRNPNECDSIEKLSNIYDFNNFDTSIFFFEKKYQRYLEIKSIFD